MHSTFERPFKPIEFTAGTIDAFNLQALANQLMKEKPFTEHGRNALTLTRHDDHTTVLTVAKAGKSCQEHSPGGTTTIVMLSGSATLMTNGDNQKIPLTNGMAAAFASDVTHRIEALTDSTFLTMIGGKL
jgi:quercetin dioxygenase-like cupin family protein